MSQSSISAFRIDAPAGPRLVERARGWAASCLQSPSPCRALTPCLGLAAIGSTILWAGILSIGALLVA